MDQSFMYKGVEAKIFDNDKVKQAEADGWFDNPGDAALAIIPPIPAAQIDNPPDAAGSGAVTTDASGSGAVTGKI